MARKSTSDPGTSARNQKSIMLSVGGLMNVPVNMYSPKQSKGDNLVSVCATCHDDDEAEETEVKQVYFGEDCKHGPFSYAEVLRATEDDNGQLRVVGTPDEVKAAKAANEVADKMFDVVAHPAEDIEANTYPVGTPYVLRPQPGTSSPLFPLFLARIGHDGRITMEDGRVLTLIGEVTMKSTKLMQLRTWNGQLVAQELCRPESLHHFDAIPGEADERFFSVIDDAFDLVATDFDPDTYEDEARKRLDAFIEAGIDGDAGSENAAVIPIDRAAASAEDMMAKLEASVAAAKAKTATPKKSTKKAS